MTQSSYNTTQHVACVFYKQSTMLLASASHDDQKKVAMPEVSLVRVFCLRSGLMLSFPLRSLMMLCFYYPTISACHQTL